MKSLQLEITREKDRLKISAVEQEAGEASTVRHYEEILVSMDRIGSRCQEITETLNHANRKGRLTKELLTRLKEVGQVFRDELFTSTVKEKLNKTQADHLVLNLDDQLVHVPWELFHDGNQFLSQRFNMGRLVKTRQPVSSSDPRLLSPPFKMLILADPKGDLKAAYNEGLQIRDHMEQKSNFINVALRSDGITSDFIKEKIRKFDMVHFAGHADYNRKSPEKSGWKLSQGIISAQEILKMAGTAAMPALVFSNACQSARTGEWVIKRSFQEEIFGLANAFILSGVKHYVGTFWEILDDPGRCFAISFYKHLISGSTMGESMRLARLKVIKKYGEQTIVWASYLLYGDPTTIYLAQEKKADISDNMDKPKPAPLPSPDAEARAREEVIDFVVEKPEKRVLTFLKIAAGVLVVIMIAFWGYTGFVKTSIMEYEKKALSDFNTGSYAKAAETCQTLQAKYPEHSLSYVVLGNISFLEGNLEHARKLFHKANTLQGTDNEKADAMIGLGRIASLENKTDMALNFYEQAAKLAPGKWPAYLSQAVLLDQKGNHDEAVQLLDKARDLSPDNMSLDPLSKRIRKRADLAQSREKQELINRMIHELLDNFDKSISPPPSDGWTARPLTVWLMDFDTIGYSLQEGEEKILYSNIVHRLSENHRIRIVERALLDKLTEELRLGSSRLTDKDNALSLGKIIAARLILSGRIIHSVPQVQVTIRFIETETGQVLTVINETFTTQASLSTIAEKLSDRLLEKFKALYPLRAKIIETKGKDLVLNVGGKQGVVIGQKFKAVDTDLIAEVIMLSDNQSTAVLIKNSSGNIESGLRMEIKP